MLDQRASLTVFGLVRSALTRSVAVPHSACRMQVFDKGEGRPNHTQRAIRNNQQTINQTNILEGKLFEPFHVATLMIKPVVSAWQWCV